MDETSNVSEVPVNELLAEVKAKGTVASLRNELPDLTDDDIDKAMRPFMAFDEEPPIEPGYERITVVKDGSWVPDSGKSLKAGNLRFNLGGLFEAIVSGVGAGLAAAATPVYAALLGLVAVRTLKRASEVSLTAMDALVIWSLWSCEQSAPVPTEVDVRDKALQEAVRVGAGTRPSLEDVHRSLKVLEGIGAVRQIGDRWETTESIVVRTGTPK